jgi:hypothetical protein
MRSFAFLVGFIICFFIFIDKVIFTRKKSFKTSDIALFWQAYDQLKQVRNTTDSINIIQHQYLDQMSPDGKKFIEARNYTAHEYVSTLQKYPRYFVGLRKKTDHLSGQLPAIDTALSKLNAAIPHFKYPNIYFAIGCFRGEGTKTKDKETVLIGCEIALADSTMDISEFKGTLHNIFSHADGNITSLAAHESIHCQQWNGQNNSLLSMALAEGGADFLTQLVLHKNINQALDTYGLQHECALWQEFEPQMGSEDISHWLYNAAPNETRPADLGYFIGRRICEAYYNKQTNKKQAIINLLNRGKYLAVMKESGYSGGCRN